MLQMCFALGHLIMALQALHGAAGRAAPLLASGLLGFEVRWDFDRARADVACVCVRSRLLLRRAAVAHVFG